LGNEVKQRAFLIQCRLDLALGERAAGDGPGKRRSVAVEGRLEAAGGVDETAETTEKKKVAKNHGRMREEAGANMEIIAQKDYSSQY
jgi:hypothetical protein